MFVAMRVAVVLAVAMGAIPPAVADPALWKIQKGDATIWLFGTVHVLPPDANWHYPMLDGALAASKTLYVEENDDDPTTMQPLILQYGIDPAHPLAGEVGVADEQRLQAAAQTAGIPPQALETMRPWLAAVTLTVAPIVKAGFDPDSGADKQLRKQFAAQGKPVEGLESAAQQIRFFANLPEPAQVSMLRSTLDDYTKAASEIGELVQDWERGDVAGIANIENSDLRANYPALYQVLLVDRNRRWAQRIAQMLDGHSSVTIAVGAAHLAGPDDVQAQLQKFGITVKRVK